jgi:peptidyl-prolyl cis-trans isomerase NIMA-interacting 1
MLRARLLFPFLLTACGAGTPPPAPPPAETAAPKAEAAPAAPKVDSAAAEQCLAGANAKRARFSGEPGKISVRHILVKHKGAKNPVAGVTRTREEACLRAAEARDKLRQGAEWDAVVKEYSDDPGAATRSGTLGSVERKELQKPFADAAFELSVNMMSDVVETESGFHLVFRFE